MIIYNQTIKVEYGINAPWLRWMKDQYLPGVMSTGLFTGYHFSRLLGYDEEDGLTYTVQIFCNTLDDHTAFIEFHSFSLQQTGLQLFGQKYLYFETLMETIV